MRLRVIVLLLAAACSVSSLSAKDYWKNGNDLYKECQPESPQVSLAYYLMGMDDGIEQANENSSYCLPSNVVARQVVDVFCKHLRDNPDDRHFVGPYLARRAFSKAWPCP